MGIRKTTQPGRAANRRFHPSQASDELVFAVCQRFLAQTGKSRKGVASAVVQWFKETYGRADVNREMVYPLVTDVRTAGDVLP